MFIYIFLFYLFILVLFLFLLFMFMFINNMSFFIELLILEISSLKFEILIYIDYISLLFSSVVLFISMMVIYYSLEYMVNDKFKDRFIYLIIMFIMSMMLLIYMPNLISILLGWDGLGLVSYCLVIYYQSKSSFNSGMVTVLTNRVGDILIMISISMFVIVGSWNYMFLGELNYFIYLMLMLASFTKSAQIPFSSWLPMAMAAPTPVSSLVHSSTLVTAGVYLLIRLNYLFNNIWLLNMMMLISVITMFLSGLGANFEYDLKKIIALSTLSQLGVMMFSLSMNLVEVSLFHLLTHAMFKSMLFMCAGIIIHCMMNHQDIRFISMTTYNLPLISMMFNCSSMSLCGIPFLSGFFSKDLILELFLMNMFNKFILIILFISMGLTLMYSLRLMYYSFIKMPQLLVYSKFMCFNNKMFVSLYLLFFMAILMGSSLSWILFSSKNLIFLTMNLKLLIYLFMFMGLIMGLIVQNIFLSISVIIYCNKFFKFFMMLWFMPMLYKDLTINTLIISSNFNYYLDFSWLEYFGMLGAKFLLIKYFKMDFLYKNYFFSIMIFMIIILFILF